MAEHNLLTRTDMGDGVANITLNRAPVNALSSELLVSLAALLDELEADSSVKSVVLSSDYKVFSAGLDLKEAIEFSVSQQNEIVKELDETFLKMFLFPKPVVIAVDGAAIAGGLFFVLVGDYRVASPRSQFGVAEVRVGADFPAGLLQIARASLSSNNLRRMMLTGRPVRADVAQSYGIVDLIVESDAVLQTAVETARDLSNNPPATYAAIKLQLRDDVVTQARETIRQSGHVPRDGWFTDETKPAMQRMIG